MTSPTLLRTRAGTSTTFDWVRKLGCSCVVACSDAKSSAITSHPDLILRSSIGERLKRTNPAHQFSCDQPRKDIAGARRRTVRPHLDSTAMSTSVQERAIVERRLHTAELTKALWLSP